MQPLQRLYDREGNEVCLFPMKDLYLSTARDPAEHQLLAMDFFGWDNGLRIYNCPCYAPFSGSVVYTGNDHNMIFWSTNPVRLVDGRLSHLSILVAHSMTAPPSVGTTIVQGQQWYYSGNYGQSTGDHLHMEVALGHVMWDSSGTHLESPEHMYDVFSTNDTVISRGMSYNWREYTGGVTPTGDTKKHHYKFVLMERRRRSKLYEQRKNIRNYNNYRNYRR